MSQRPPEEAYLLYLIPFKIINFLVGLQSSKNTVGAVISNNICTSQVFYCSNSVTLAGVSAGKILVAPQRFCVTRRFANYKLDSLRLWGLPFTNDRLKSTIQVCTSAGRQHFAESFSNHTVWQ